MISKSARIAGRSGCDVLCASTSEDINSAITRLVHLPGRGGWVEKIALKHFMAQFDIWVTLLDAITITNLTLEDERPQIRTDTNLSKRLQSTWVNPERVVKDIVAKKQPASYSALCEAEMFSSLFQSVGLKPGSSYLVSNFRKKAAKEWSTFNLADGFSLIHFWRFWQNLW